MPTPTSEENSPDIEGGKLVAPPRQLTSNESFPCLRDDNDNEETYATLERALSTGVGQDIRLQPSDTSWFTRADAHVWIPLALSGTMFVGGNFLLRYARNVHLLGRRRRLLGLACAFYPIRSYLDLGLGRQYDYKNMLRDRPACAPALLWSTSIASNEKLCSSIRSLEQLSIHPSAVTKELEMEQNYLNWDWRSRGECIFPCLLDHSRFNWSSPKQRAAISTLYSEIMEEARMPARDQVLFPAHVCLLANRQNLISPDLPTRILFTAVLGLGFVVQAPIALGLLQMAGSAALTVQAVIAILDLHMLHDAWMYADIPALEQALTSNHEGRLVKPLKAT